MKWPFVLRRRIYDDLAAEIQQHLEERTDALVDLGMARTEAEHQARREFGNVTLLEERSREAWQFPKIELSLADVRYALRQLRKSPGFALAAILTLGLGIGTNTAIFTLIDSIMLRPLPFSHQERLARIAVDASPFPKGWIRELESHSQSFSSISGYGPNAESNVSRTGASERVFGAKVTVNIFETLGIHPLLGDFFSAENGVAGQDLVVVLGYGYWRDHFAGDPRVLGESMRIDGISRRIIGVMPAGVHFPYSDTQFVIPVAFKSGDPIDPWREFDLWAFGRLKAGIRPAEAQAELRRLHPLLLPLFPWRMPDIWAANVTVVPLLESIVGDMRPKLLLLFGSAGLILLIACANVANLMLAKAVSREREMAIRGALGASAWRIMRQLLAESVLLGALAGSFGLVMAYLSLRVFSHLLPADTPRLSDVGLHLDVILFAATASVLAGFLFGLVPAIKMASPNLQQALRSGSLSVIGKASQLRLSALLVVGQIGLSVVVMIGAGLMLRTLYSLSRVSPGFRTDRIVTAEVSLDATACQQRGRCQAFFENLDDRAAGIAGIEMAALVDTLPMTGWDLNYVYDAEGHPRDPRQGARLAAGRTVSTRYFQVVGLRLLRGRLLTDSDRSGSSRAAVINQRMAESLWPRQDPIGKRLLSVNDEKSPAIFDPNMASIVVGVVGNTHHGSLSGGFDDEVYLPLTSKNERPSMSVLLRSRTTATQAADSLRTVVAALDPLAPVTHVRTLDQVVSDSASAPRLLATLLLVFGLLAVGVGAVGVYSLIAYTVNWRTREIGVRLALGARRWQVVRAIAQQSLLLAVLGSAAGLLVATGCTRLQQQFLFEVSPVDPLTFCAAPVLMMFLALLAAWVPARRASLIDPVRALRAE
jgi:putative ABC transport system permease protein